MVDTPRTLSFLLGTHFPDGQAPGAVSANDFRDAWVSVYPTAISVMNFGAAGNGSTNDTAAFNAGLAALSGVGGGTLIVPPLSFLLDPITIPSHVEIRGSVEGPFSNFGLPGTAVVAPTLLVNSTASAFITMNFSSKLRNVVVYYPGQVAPTSATPTSYPVTINIPYNNNGCCSITGVTLVNSYKGIFVGSGYCILDRINIGAFSNAIEVDGAEDYMLMDNIRITPIYDLYASLNPPQTIDTWVRTNGTGIILRRVDELLATNIGLFGMMTGISLLDTTVGATPYTSGYGLFQNVSLDTVAYGVYAQSTNHVGQGFKFVNMDVVGNPSGVGTSGVAALAMISGGSDSPVVTWNGGAAWGTFSATKGLSLGTGGGAFVTNVRGVNPYGLISAPSIPSSGANLTNTYGMNVRVHVAGGTVTAVGINGTPTGLTSGSFLLGPGDIITLVYSVAPSWTWFGN